ncbi:MAG TPA: antitoxin VapB family protein [Candidatus Nanoarchaeia archaeon]|nr:antitoxin VapB family protein [Candidatus Nanoarchaeia archaeon]
MVTKTLTITEDAYKLMTRSKRHDESFSEEITRVFTKRKPLSAFAGLWKMSEEEANKMKDVIKNIRKHTSEDVLKKLYP